MHFTDLRFKRRDIVDVTYPGRISIRVTGTNRQALCFNMHFLIPHPRVLTDRIPKWGYSPSVVASKVGAEGIPAWVSGPATITGIPILGRG
jgi:hypothetical protein